MKKQCYFSQHNIKHIDYKDTEVLRRFLNPHGRMINRSRTGICAKYQREARYRREARAIHGPSPLCRQVINRIHPCQLRKQNQPYLAKRQGRLLHHASAPAAKPVSQSKSPESSKPNASSFDRETRPGFREAESESNPASPAAKAKSAADVASALDAIRVKFGEDSIMKLGDKPKVNIGAISTGSIGLDAALGIGGLPCGRIIEIFGPESSGKTTLALHVVAEAQKKGGVCAYIDAEHAMDPDYARKIGVKVDDLLISQPDTGEQALEIVDSLIRTGKMDVVVIDSVAALTPKAEIEGDMGAFHVGTQARLMSQALRKLTAIVAKSKTVVIFINQIRMQIGVMFGNPETTPGGKALKFYASVRLDIRRIAQIKKGEEVMGGRSPRQGRQE